MEIKKTIELLRGRLYFARVMIQRGKELGSIRESFLEWARTKIDDNQEAAESIVFYNCGDRNKDKHIFFIRLDTNWVPTAGFCALLNRTMGGLFWAEKYSFVPVIGNWQGAAYEEKEKINGTYNVFEYYFEKVSDVSVTDALESKNVVFATNKNLDLIMIDSEMNHWFRPTEKYFDNLARVFRKYLKLNDIVNARIQHDMKQLGLKGKVLGVHYRGTDYKLNVSGHPVSYSLVEFEQNIENLIREYDFDSIFLATDDEEALIMFKKRWPNIFYYLDTKRSSGNTSVAFLVKDRLNDNYESGYEILRDIYTLASCDGLIAGLSQVATTTRIIKRSRFEAFIPERIIESKISNNGIDWVKYYRENIEVTDD